MVFTFAILCQDLNAQALEKKIALRTQIEKSDMIVEGEVVAKRSVWDDDKKLIYTLNTVKIYKVFKGNLINTIDVVTVGGFVGLKGVMAYPSLKLYIGDIGVFMLNENKTPFSKTLNAKNKKFKPYGLSQSFFRYNLLEDLAATPFSKIQNITETLYADISRFSKVNYVEIDKFDVEHIISKSKSNKTLLPPSSISLDKNEITAGTKEELTITGSGFGNTQGKVEFRNADDGGGTLIAALDSQVVSWNDSQIIVEVPSFAGTGTIRVVDSNGDASPLSSVLTVLYSEANAETDPDGTGLIPLSEFQLQHVDRNGSGGITWEMHTDFFNETEPNTLNSPFNIPVGYKDAFMRAFNKWVCETGINWAVSDTPTSVDSSGDSADGTFVIRFDNGDELGANTLGICYYYIDGCFTGNPTSPVNLYIEELDLVFNDNTVTWHTGTEIPAFSDYDFESIALHELGHAHLLGHVIDPNNNTIDPATGRVTNNVEDVMHYVFSNSEAQRELNVNNSTAANTIQDRGVNSNPCPSAAQGPTSSITNRTCPLSVNDAVLESGIDIYPNPAKGEFFIKNNSYLTLKTATLFDLSGRNIIDYDISEGSKLKTINLSKISSGVYFIKIASDEAAITRKLVIE